MNFKLKNPVAILITLVLNVTVIYESKSQTGFELWMEEYTGLHINHVLQLEDGNSIAVLGMNVNSDLGIVKRFIFLDQQGNIVDDLPATFISKEPFWITYFNKWNNGYILDVEYLPYIFDFDYFDEPHSKSILLLDENFTIIDSMHINTIGRCEGFASSIINDRYMFVRSEGRLLNYNIIFGTYDDVEGLEIRRINHNSLFFPSSIESGFYDNEYLIFTYPGVHTIDMAHDSLNPVSYRNIFQTYNIGNIKKLDENTLAVHGIHGTYNSDGEFFYQIIYVIADSNYNVYFTDTLAVLPDFTTGLIHNFPANVQSLDSDTNSDETFVAGNLLVPIDFYGSNSPTSFYVAKYKNKTDRQWYRIFGMDANYWITGIKATKEGGCIVYGWKRNPDTAERVPYLLKLNEEGNITSTTDPIAASLPKVEIYGNPSRDLRFKVHTDDGWQGKAYLINLLGQLVHSENITNANVEIHLPQLPASTYLLLILDRHGQVITNKKWVKVD